MNKQADVLIGRTYLSDGKLRTDKKWYITCYDDPSTIQNGMIDEAYNDTWYFLSPRHQMPGYKQDNYKCDSSNGWQVRHKVDVISDIDKTFTFSVLKVVKE